MKHYWLLDRMRPTGDATALAGQGGSVTYRDLLRGVEEWRGTLDGLGVTAGAIVAFEGDFGRDSVSLFLALLARGAVAVPFASVTDAQRPEFLRISCADWYVRLHPAPPHTERLTPGPRHPLLADLAAAGKPGLVLFSSGSSGRAKAILHDADRLLEKFRVPRPAGRILTFLLFDHIGGINTLLFTLANGGTVVTVPNRNPETVCRAIAGHRVEVLPTTPTFLNLLLLSGVAREFDLSSLRLITYGTEVMPANTLERLREQFPGVKLQQTYGLSELGILRSKSRDDGSLWVKVGGEGYETRVVDGLLWVRAKSAMLGYLTGEPGPDADGWFNTQDMVEQDGEWVRFLGRKSELINVGGQKVYPAEVESVLLGMPGVLDAAVRGEPNPLLGQCVVARVQLAAGETVAAFKDRMRQHCRGRLAQFMVPVKIEVAETPLYNHRGKRVRKGDSSDEDSPRAGDRPG